MSKESANAPSQADLTSRAPLVVSLWPALAIIVATFLLVAGLQLSLIYLHNLQIPDPRGTPIAVQPLHFSIGEYLHLAIPIAVLVMELYVIWKMAQEASDRARTISEFRAMTSHSRRAEYMLNLANAIRETKTEARFTSATMEVSCRSQGQRMILESSKARAMRSAYTHRGLIARTQRALPGAIELAIHAEHIQLRMSEVIALSRLRFFVRDREESILGVAEGPPDLADSKESTQSTRIHSRMLAAALEQQFEVLWSSALPISNYVDELITAAAPSTKTEVRRWFSAIKCEDEELDTALGKNSTLYAKLQEDTVQKPDSAPTLNSHGA